MGKDRNSFVRIYNRKDFVVELFYNMLFDNIKEVGFECVGIGKIEDIFVKRGLIKSIYIEGNMDGVDKILKVMDEVDRGLIFINFVDYDMLYGYRNDFYGYVKVLIDFDIRFFEIMEKFKKDDILIIIVDYGCDFIIFFIDYLCEYVLIFVYGDNIKKGYDLGIRKSFFDIG